MRVRITSAIASDAFSYVGGEVVDLDEPTARGWCTAGMAEPVEVPEVETPEVPEVVAAETPEQGDAPVETTATRSRARSTRSTKK